MLTSYIRNVRSYLRRLGGLPVGLWVGLEGYVVGDVIPLLVNRLQLPVSCLDALSGRGRWITLRGVLPDEVGTGRGGGKALIHQVVT